MARDKSLAGNVVRLFDDHADEIPETVIEVVGGSTSAAPVSSTGSGAVDLTGKPKIVMVFGPGSSGKSHLLRYLAEKAVARDDGEPPTFASVDVGRPTLKRFVPGTMMPKSADPTISMSWLEKLLGWLIETRKTAAIDFGADMTVLPILAQVPDLVAMASESGVEIVSLNMLTPRQGDLSLLNSMEQGGFQPLATGLLLNMGAMKTVDAEAEFASVRRHSIYRAAIERGAVEVWIPKLHAAKAVEDRGIGFAAATNHALGSDAVPALNLFERGKVSAWIGSMNRSLAPLSSWLP